MAAYDEILDQVPVSQLAQQLGVGDDEVREAAASALPALLGGMHANADDPAGAASLLSALSDHQDGVSDVRDIDPDDGRAIVGNIFGDRTDQVVNQLGGLGGGALGPLVQKLLPLLAPIVLSWLAKKVGGAGGLGGSPGRDQPDTTASPSGQAAPEDGPLFPGGQGAGSGPVEAPTGATGSAPAPDQQPASNPLQDVLGQVLGGSPSGSGGAGDILGGLLGGLLGRGRR